MGHNRAVITSIEIENFRGIRTGRLDGLAPLTILTGPNGCGKSSVLDALLIGATWTPGNAISRAIQRHLESVDGGRWLFRDRTNPARLTVEMGGARIERRLIWVEHPVPEPEFETLARRQTPGPFRQIACLTRDGSRLAQVFLGINNDFVVRVEKDTPGPAVVGLLLDPATPIPLEDTYSEIWRRGKKQYAVQLLERLVPGLDSIDILVEANRQPRLYLTKTTGAVPVSLSGDGIQALLQSILQLSLIPQDGLALVEEPEVFLHPRAIHVFAEAIVGAVAQGIQVVLTTHSLELIDAILGKCDDDSLLSLFNLRLVDGELQSTLPQGAEMRFVRNQIEDDLRT